MKDLYKILGISRGATPDEIRKAYRKLARELHPDVNNSPEAKTRFQELNNANNVLTDLSLKADYDKKYEEIERRNRINEEMKIYGATDEADLARRKAHNDRMRNSPEFKQSQGIPESKPKPKFIDQDMEAMFRMQFGPDYKTIVQGNYSWESDQPKTKNRENKETGHPTFKSAEEKNAENPWYKDFEPGNMESYNKENSPWEQFKKRYEDEHGSGGESNKG